MTSRRSPSLQEFTTETETQETADRLTLRLATQSARLRLAQSEVTTLRNQLAIKDRELSTLLALDGEQVHTHVLKPTTGHRNNEATAFLIASDWHVEERVESGAVNGLNSYDLKESRRRAGLFFTRGMRLIDVLSRDIAIPHVVLALLGDFITNSIHEDAAESNLLSPVDATLLAAEYLASGIQFLLDHTKRAGTQFFVPCHSGNHARTTRERRISTEHGNSLERMMYVLLARHFRQESRIKFDIAEGYHSYIDCYGKIIRLSHGHHISYGGGIGGITIPVEKAISKWQKSRHADFDVFGHFHQYKDGDHWMGNGSMIGWNPFAISIKAEFQPPKQALFLWDKKRGSKTIAAPILFQE